MIDELKELFEAKTIAIQTIMDGNNLIVIEKCLKDEGKEIVFVYEENGKKAVILC